MRISIDDGRREMLQAAELLDKHGLEGVFYIAPYDEKITMNVREIIRLSQTQEIGGHTLYHTRLTRVSLQEAKTEVEKGKQELEAITGREITKFAYPRGWHNPEVMEIVRNAGFKEGRTMKMGITDRTGYDDFAVPVTAQNYPRPEYIHGNEQGIKDMFDEAKAKNGYFNLVIHTDDIKKYKQWDMIDRVFGYISKNR